MRVRKRRGLDQQKAGEDKRTALLRQLNDAKRTGDSEYARELQEEIDALDGKVKAASGTDAVSKEVSAKADAIQGALSANLRLDPTVEDAGNGSLRIILDKKITLPTVVSALARSRYLVKETSANKNQKVIVGKQLVFFMYIPSLRADLHVFTDMHGAVESIQVE